MSEILDKLKDIAGIIKIILPLVGLGSASSSVFTGGNRVFKGYATAHNIEIQDASSFSADILSNWGRNIVLMPVDRLTENPAAILVFVILLILAAYLLLYHLLCLSDSKPGHKPKHDMYVKHHGKLTLLIYIVLVFLIISPVNLHMFFFGLVLFLVFFSVHMYTHFSVLKSNVAEEKIAYIIPIFLAVIVSLFVPTVFGSKFFDPTVWSPDIDTEQNQVRVKTRKSAVSVYFVKPVMSGKVSVGELIRKSDNSWTMSVVTMEKDNSEKDGSLYSGEEDSGYTSVALSALLNMEIVAGDGLYPAEDIEDMNERIAEEIGNKEETDVSDGYDKIF